MRRFIARVRAGFVISALLPGALIALAMSWGDVAGADVVEVKLTEWGPQMPLGPGETGQQLFGVGPTVTLDAQLQRIEVVQAEQREVRTVIDGQPAMGKRMYYFVRVPFEGQGYRQLRELQDEAGRRSERAEAHGHSIHTSVQIAGTEQANRVFFDHEAQTAELRLVLFEQQLLPLLRAVQRDWHDDDQQSTINRWTNGELAP